MTYSSNRLGREQHTRQERSVSIHLHKSHLLQIKRYMWYK
jgi:hypothetical protein